MTSSERSGSKITTRLLDAGETRERVAVDGAVGGFWNREGAAIQPARLARGLARAVERAGATIYEQTRVTDFVPGSRPILRTAVGDVRARAIVLAGEAYLSQLEKTARQIIPMTSHMVVTEPLTQAQWQEIGWDAREVLGGFGVTGAYINHTADGRIAFGPYRGNYPYNSKITDELDRDEAIFAHARESFKVWWPMLKEVQFYACLGRGVWCAARPHADDDPMTGRVVWRLAMGTPVMVWRRRISLAGCLLIC